MALFEETALITALQRHPYNPLNLVTLFFDRGTGSLRCSFNNQGTGEGHELLNTKQTRVIMSLDGRKHRNSEINAAQYT